MIERQRTTCFVIQSLKKEKTNMDGDGTGPKDGNNQPPIIPLQPPSTARVQIDGENQQAHVARISVRAPPFWKENPALWFKQLESQFHTNAITASDTKYHIAVAALDTAVISQVSDIIMNPPVLNKYETLKDRLQERYAESEERRFKKLMSNVHLGDKKPSHLWREMRELAGVEVNDNLLKSLWLQRLPAQIQTFVSTDEGDMPRVLIRADKIHEIIDSRNDIQSVSTNVTSHVQPPSPSTAHASALPPQNIAHNSQLDQLCAQINALTIQMAQIAANNGVQQQRGRSASRGNSKSRPRSESNNNKVCFYHRRFGKDAQKCTKPCTFMQPEN